MQDIKEFEAHFNHMMRARGSNATFDRFESAETTNDGIRLHLDVIETTTGAPTVVFVPGTAAYGLVYGDYLASLADNGMNVVSVDPRGHGRSEGRRGSYTIEELVSDARASVRYARERFGGDIFLSGSSQGGVVAFYTAASDEDLAGVICHNAADLADPRNLEATANPAVTRALKAIVIGVAQLFPEKTISMERYFNLLSKGEHKAKARIFSNPYMLKYLTLKSLASLSTASMERPVEEIETPVFFLHAQQDTIFPKAMTQRLVDRLNCDKMLKIYPDLGHFLFSEHVSEVMPDIIRWVSERASHGNRLN